MAIQLCGHTMPASMSSRASNDAQEWDYLYTTVLGGAPSVRSNVTGSTVVYDNQRQEKGFDHAIVHRPQYKILTGGDYQQVTLLIDQLR